MTDLFTEDETNNICRACLKNSDCLRPIYISHLKDIFVKLTSLEILENDGYPSHLCVNCVERLQASNSFRELCIKSDKYLKSRKTKKDDTGNKLSTDTDIVLTKDEEYWKTEEESDHLHEDTIQNDDSSFHYDSDREDETKNEEAEEKAIIKQKRALHPCQQCDKKFALLITLKKHVQKKHPTSDNNNKGYKKKLSRTLIADLSCPKCGQGFKKQDRLEAHLRVHQGKKPEVCTECNAEFDHLRNLKIHMLKHPGLRKFECLECGKCFTYQSKLRLHERIHLGIRPYICDICGKSFHTCHNLKLHMTSHSVERPYACESCPKKFKCSASLRTHVFRRHTGIKNFICTLCGHRSTMKGDLKEHMKIHSQEKPYACSFCPKKFKKENNLTTHNRTHTGERPYKCDLCPMSFTASKVLKHHRMTHTGEKPHVCTVCHRAFIQKSALKIHMKTHNRPKVSY